MKKEYVKPIMYIEAFSAEQFVAASDCGVSVGVPSHGHFTNSAGETHCAFTSSNCGANATTCCSSFSTSKHQVITNENGTVIQRPNSSYHNCHVLSTNAAAQAFVATYDDEKCGAGVANIMGLGSFEDIVNAFS